MLYVAIGRNVGVKPMKRRVWREFQKRVIETVASDYLVDSMPDTVAYGKSNYGGAPEETCVMVWFDGKGLGDMSRILLGLLATMYGQDSIAWSVSETEFVEGF